jgi:microsomal epoxide hydrolase
MGLNDSPAGLAAYIVEKLSVWSGCSVNESSSCLESHFTKDELLTNVMIYWVTNSITSSMRFYKETIGSNIPRGLIR